jgi:hypothetical protein
VFGDSEKRGGLLRPVSQTMGFMLVSLSGYGLSLHLLKRDALPISVYRMGGQCSTLSLGYDFDFFT